MCRPTNTHAKTHISRHVCTVHTHMLTHRHTHTHIHQASRQANQASGPRSLMFVKVINFLCEIRGHGGRTEGDGCQPQNLSLLSSTGTGALWVHSTGPLHGHRGYPRIPLALTNKGSEWGKRRKTQMKGNAKKEMERMWKRMIQKDRGIMREGEKIVQRDWGEHNGKWGSKMWKKEKDGRGVEWVRESEYTAH